MCGPSKDMDLSETDNCSVDAAAWKGRAPGRMALCQGGSIQQLSGGSRDAKTACQPQPNPLSLWRGQCTENSQSRPGRLYGHRKVDQGEIANFPCIDHAKDLADW